VPGFERADSLLVLFIVNAVMIANVWFARALPRWRARRVATTWCATERSRFLT